MTGQWDVAAAAVRQRPAMSEYAAIVALDWAGLDGGPLKGLSVWAAQQPVSQVVQGVHLALVPGAHLALHAPSERADEAGLALRLAGFEIRDTVAVVRGDDITYWILARKELEGAVIDTTLAFGTGGINIDACRVRTESGSRGLHGGGSEGRWPPNMMLDDVAAAAVDVQAPEAGGAGPASGPSYSGESQSHSMAGKFKGMGDKPPTFHGDSGGASRFFPRVRDDGGFSWIAALITPPRREPLLVLDDACAGLVTAEGYPTKR